MDKAFWKFDAEAKGWILSSDLKKSFNYDIHPKVITMQMTQEQVFADFISNFPADPSNHITKKVGEFL